jgi:hypothetical protein
VRKCSASNSQFADITRDIRLKSLGGGQSQSLSLEDLLHKPVARVQKNALVLHVSTNCNTAIKHLLHNFFAITFFQNIFPVQTNAEFHEQR